MGLAAAIGDLPADKQAEITTIVQEALSQSAAQVADAQAKLAAKDVELKTATAARGDAEAKATQLATTVQLTSAAQSAAEAALTAKTDEVKTWAAAKAASDANGDFLGNYVHRLLMLGVLIGVIYLFVHFILPSLAAQFPAVRSLTTIYNFVTSIFSAHTVSVPGALPPAPK